jgi:hypothetical protein
MISRVHVLAIACSQTHQIVKEVEQSRKDGKFLGHASRISFFLAGHGLLMEGSSSKGVVGPEGTAQSLVRLLIF